MVRVGMVGLGHNGIAHLKAHRRVRKSEIVALCDANPERLEAASKEFGIERTYRSAEELCAQPDIEAVSINTGDQFHAEPFVAAVRNGKHVLVEKPLANTREQVEAMVAAARAADPKQRLAVGYILRFNPGFEKIHEICRSGQMGQIYYLEGDYIHNLLYQAKQTDTLTGVNWYLEYERPMVGGGSHALDLLRWFSGAQVVEVSGYSNHVAFPGHEAGRLSGGAVPVRHRSRGKGGGALRAPAGRAAVLQSKDLWDDGDGGAGSGRDCERYGGCTPGAEAGGFGPHLRASL